MQTLKSPATLEFIETPLSDVVEFLKDRHKVPIQIDRTALQQAKIALQTPITMNVKNVSLRSALVLMLRQECLTCVAQQEYLVITTPEGAKKWGGSLLSAIQFKPGDKVAVKGGEFEPAANEKKIEEALKSPAVMQFVETPLADVIDFLKQRHKIEIQIDRKALREAHVAPDKPITLFVKDVSLHAALQMMLRELKLTHAVQDEVLLITAAKQGGRAVTKSPPSGKKGRERPE